MAELHGLRSGVHSLLSEDFRKGTVTRIDTSGYLVKQPLGRKVDLDPLHEILQEAMRRADNREKSDAWLAPRVHATLRLTRREASDKRIWAYLTIHEEVGYVRWRFENERRSPTGVPIVRFLGTDNKNALARLWWAGELTRNGTDYQPVETVLKNSQFFSSWLQLDAIHHRPAALGLIRFLEEFNDGKGVTNDQSKTFARELNLCLGTRCLDALAMNPEPDAHALREWCQQAPDHTLMLERLPEGPDDAPVPEEEIERIHAMLTDLADKVGLAGVKRTTSAAE